MDINFDEINSEAENEKQTIEPKKLETNPLEIEETVKKIKAIEVKAIGKEESISKDATSLKSYKSKDDKSKYSNYTSSSNYYSKGYNSNSSSQSSYSSYGNYGYSNTQKEEITAEEIIKKTIREVERLQSESRSNILLNSSKFDKVLGMKDKDLVKLLKGGYKLSFFNSLREDLVSTVLKFEIDEIQKRKGELDASDIAKQLAKKLYGQLKRIPSRRLT